MLQARNIKIEPADSPIAYLENVVSMAAKDAGVSRGTDFSQHYLSKETNWEFTVSEFVSGNNTLICRIEGFSMDGAHSISARWAADSIGSEVWLKEWSARAYGDEIDIYAFSELLETYAGRWSVDKLRF